MPVETRLMIMGFIREEKDYDDVQGLIKDIRMDCNVASKSLVEGDGRRAVEW